MPFFLSLDRNFIDLIRIHVGYDKPDRLERVIKRLDIWHRPLMTTYFACIVANKYKLKDARLNGILDHCRFKNSIIANTFSDISKKLNDAGIPVLAIKGVARRLLNNKDIRPMNDADFCVPKLDYKRAVEIAKDNGFNVMHSLYYSCDMLRGIHGAIDIHNTIFRGCSPASDKLIWSRAQRVSGFGTDVFVPCAEDLLFISACDYYGDFIYSMSSGKIDLDSIAIAHPFVLPEIINSIKNNPDLDWRRVMEIAEMSNAGYQIRAIVAQIEKIHPGIITDDAKKIMAEICPDNTYKHFIARDERIVKMYDTSRRNILRKSK